jgi:hypothetical protein
MAAGAALAADGRGGAQPPLSQPRPGSPPRPTDRPTDRRPGSNAASTAAASQVSSAVRRGRGRTGSKGSLACHSQPYRRIAGHRPSLLWSLALARRAAENASLLRWAGAHARMSPVGRAVPSTGADDDDDGGSRATLAVGGRMISLLSTRPARAGRQKRLLFAWCRLHSVAGSLHPSRAPRRHAITIGRGGGSSHIDRLGSQRGRRTHGDSCDIGRRD